MFYKQKSKMLPLLTHQSNHAITSKLIGADCNTSSGNVSIGNGAPGNAFVMLP